MRGVSLQGDRWPEGLCRQPSQRVSHWGGVGEARLVGCQSPRWLPNTDHGADAFRLHFSKFLFRKPLLTSWWAAAPSHFFRVACSFRLCDLHITTHFAKTPSLIISLSQKSLYLSKFGWYDPMSAFLPNIHSSREPLLTLFAVKTCMDHGIIILIIAILSFFIRRIVFILITSVVTNRGRLCPKRHSKCWSVSRVCNSYCPVFPWVWWTSRSILCRIQPNAYLTGTRHR